MFLVTPPYLYLYVRKHTKGIGAKKRVTVSRTIDPSRLAPVGKKCQLHPPGLLNELTAIVFIDIEAVVCAVCENHFVMHYGTS